MMETPERLGKYLIHESLRRDAFGITYRATDTTSDRVVALCILDPLLARQPGFLARLRGAAQAAGVIARLNPLTSFTQRWSLWLQFKETDWALNMALWRIRYLIFRLQYAPWLDLVRMPWDLYEKYRPMFAGALIAGSIRVGHAYAGQIIINLPNFLTHFGVSLREVRTWAGLSGYLNHIKYTRLPAHMFWVSLAVSIPSLVSKWGSDIQDYAGGKYSGTELASALTVDTALTLAPAATTFVGAKLGAIGGAKIGALIGTFVAGPGVGTAIGGAVGAIAGGILAGWATNEVIERTDIREKTIPWLDQHVFGPIAGAISSGANAVSNWIDDMAIRMRQNYEDMKSATDAVVSRSAKTSTLVPDPLSLDDYPDHDEGAGPFKSEAIRAEDYIFESILRAGTVKFQLEGKDDAAGHMNHYLAGTGNTLNISIPELLQEEPGFQADAEDYRAQLLSTINERVIANYVGEPMHLEIRIQDMPWQSFYAESDNWYYAMGGFSYTYTAVVDVQPSLTAGEMPTIKVGYQLHVSDHYNWDNGKSVSIPNIQGTIPILNTDFSIGVPSLGVYDSPGMINKMDDVTVVYDAALARLHRVGLAKEYAIVGVSDVNIIQYNLDVSSLQKQSPPVFD